MNAPMSFQRDWSRVLFGMALAVSTLGCGGATVSPSDDGGDGSRATEAGAGVDAADLIAEPGGEGHIRLTGPTGQLTPGDFVELVPSGPWPTGDARRPAQLILLVTRVAANGADSIAVGHRGTVHDLSRLYGRRVDRADLPLSKSVTTVLSRDGRELRLDARATHGVASGDYFFVLGQPAADPDRLGSRIIALVRVTETTAAGSTASIMHEMAEFGPGALAIFAHHASPETERPEALILFAATRPDVPADGFSLPPLAEAVVDYQSEFQFSNIRIQTLGQFIDPAGYDAPERAQELAPEEGFGVLVFGLEREDDFLYNITTYGASPSLATSVGILPGGLPLPAPEGLSGLSASLAPSFLATAMTQRGDQAETIYFLEYCLRNRGISGPVAFHLREHLALRYENIGRPLEGLWLMNRDIRVARDQSNPYAELNALSIREYLHRNAKDYDSELADLDSFLAVADDVLPDESLISERLERSRVLARLDRPAEALELLDEVIRQAQRQQSLRWEVSASMARAGLIFDQGQADEAVALLTDTLSDARVVGESYPRYCHALLAQFLAELQRNDEALLNVQAAIQHATANETTYPLASTYELAATLHYNFDNVPEAVANMRQAAQLYSEIDQFEDMARALLQVGMLEMGAAVRSSDPRFLGDAYDHLSKAADTFLAIGEGASAAQAFGGMGLVNAFLRHTTPATANYGRTIDLGAAYNDPETVATAYHRVAELHLSQDQLEQAQLALQSARLWARTFGLADLLQELDLLEQSMRDEI